MPLSDDAARRLPVGVAGLLAVVLVLALAGCAPPAWLVQSVGAGNRTPVDASATTTVPVTPAWTVAVPPGAAPKGADVVVSTTAAQRTARLWPADRTHVLATADVALTSGQPKVPVTFTYRLPAPLPTGQVLYLVDDTADAATVLAESTSGSGVTAPTPASVLVATMSADRTVGTVTTTHLSLKTWLVDVTDAVVSTVGQLTSQRYDAPHCDRSPPSWMTDDPVFVDDVNGPIETCVQSDPKNPDTAVVKVVANRGALIAVTASVTPSWAWESKFGISPTALGRVHDLTGQVLQALFSTPPGELSRTWLLLPGSEVDIGFAKSLMAASGSVTVHAHATPRSYAAGEMFALVNAAKSVVGAAKPANVALSLWQLGGLAFCAGKAAFKAVDDGVSGVGQAVLALGQCVIDNAEKITALLIDVLGADAWASIKDQVIKVAADAKYDIGPALALTTVGFLATDAITTLKLDPAAWTVTLYPPPLPAVNRGQLLSAPVPAECQHPAGKLHNGELPGLTTDQGFEFISIAPSAGTAGLPAVFPQLVDAQSRDAAVVMSCSAGGVSWPEVVLVYGPGPTLLGAVDLGNVANQEHADVTSISSVGNSVQLAFRTYEGAGFDIHSWTARIVWNGHAPVLTGVTRTG